MRAESFPYSYAVECYRVPFAVHANDPSALVAIANTIEAALPVAYEVIAPSKAVHHIYYRARMDGQDSLYGGPSGESFRRVPRESVLGTLQSWIRLKVAEFAPDRVFVHAAVVGFDDKAIVIPGKSYSGKTTLALELIRRGATYYSDEYAVIDDQGFVEPYPKKLSIRGELNEYTQLDHEAEKFGADTGTKRIPISTVVLSKYSPAGRWTPKILSAGEGVLAMLENTVSARTNPTFVLATLTTVAGKVRFVRSERGEASKTAEWLIGF